MSVRIVQNRRYPVAPNPWKGGIQFYDDVHGHLPLTLQGLDPYFEPAYKVIFEVLVDYGQGNGSAPSLKQVVQYQCLPHCVFDQQNRYYVSYYAAENQANDPPTWDYAISP